MRTVPIFASQRLASQWTRRNGSRYRALAGFIATAAISGVVDVDAMTVIATRAMSTGEIGVQLAALATTAVASNTLTKSTIAFIAGGDDTA